MSSTLSSSALRFAVVCPAWNCAQWVERSLRSLQTQTYRDFRCVLIDDVSSDATFETAQRVVAADGRFTVLRNEQRQFPLANIVRATALAARGPDDVVVILDADDWLKHERVLERLAEVYSDPEVWLTYGSNELYNKPWKARLLRRTVRGQAAPYPRSVASRNLYRVHPGRYLAVHLRSYRKFLWDAIRDEDLRDDDGHYFRTCADPATMWPMMEMATQRHLRYLPEILYVYNNGHGLSETRKGISFFEQDQFIANIKLRARPRYQPLEP